MPKKDPELYRAYMRDYMRKQYERNMEWIRQLKVEQGCMDCGYNTHHAGLEFDHRDGRREGQEFSISQIMSHGKKRIQEEIDKCDIVCGTCHNIRTWIRRQN